MFVVIVTMYDVAKCEATTLVKIKTGTACIACVGKLYRTDTDDERCQNDTSYQVKLYTFKKIIHKWRCHM